MKLKLVCSKRYFSTFASLLFCGVAVCQNPRTEVAGISINNDEEKVKPYTLPDPLVLENGDKVTNSDDWFSKRRPEILRLFTTEQFGKMPERKGISFEVFEEGTLVFDGAAIRKQITIYFTEDKSDHKADLLIYLPTKTKEPAPLLLKIDGVPNSLAVDDPGVRQGMMWSREGKRIPSSEGRKRWSRLRKPRRAFDVEKFISNGIGVATIYYGDIEPDFPDGIKHGIRGHYLKKGRNMYPAPDEWGTISAWAWGLSCAMDYLETDVQVDSKKVALYGTSRLGRTVL